MRRTHSSFPDLLSSLKMSDRKVYAPSDERAAEQRYSSMHIYIHVSIYQHLSVYLSPCLSIYLSLYISWCSRSEHRARWDGCVSFPLPKPQAPTPHWPPSRRPLNKDEPNALRHLWQAARPSHLPQQLFVLGRLSLCLSRSLSLPRERACCALTG